jgi:Rrf2 family protein
MKMLSRKACYALQALAVLAKGGSARPLIASEVAARSNSPSKFLEVILLNLTRAGIVVSKRGKGGGYTLSSPADETSVGRVIRAIDGPIDPLPCLREASPERCDECPGELTMCSARFVMARIREAVAGVLDGTTLADFAAATEIQRAPRMVFNP